LLRRLIQHHVRPHLGELIGAGVLMLVVAGATAASAWLMQPAIDLVLIAGDKRWLILVPLAVVAVSLVKAAGSYFESVLMNRIGQEIIAETQVEMYAHLIRADLAYLHRMHTGKLISSFLYDATLLRDAVSRALTGMVRDFFSLVFLGGVLFYQHWQMSLAVMFVYPMVAIAARNMGKRSRKGSMRSQEETGRLATILNETFEGARLVKAYGMEERETERAQKSVRIRLSHLMRVVRARSAAAPVTEALGGLAIAIAILIGGWQAAAGEVTPGAFGAFLAALLMAYRPLKSLASLNSALQEGLAAADRLFAVLDVEPTIKEAPDAKPLQVTGGEIRFEGVGFSYGEDVPALTGIDLVVPAGKKVALVGPSGAGKSTILNLIPRFYDASSGRVLIDGQNVRTTSLFSLRQSIALVSQEMTLFDDTVRANIAYGRPRATEEEIIAAAKAAAADEFINVMPQGYDTLVGENGVKLSGGQRQRIAIARAMLRDAPILLLDEATSSLDTESERKVQAALQRLTQGRTTLLIAHRLSSVLEADSIYVIDQGRVVEHGRHAELLARGGLYAKLYTSQFTGDGKITPFPRTAS
jgi:subfamily B ATP-binding cassette protein MsbA